MLISKQREKGIPSKNGFVSLKIKLTKIANKNKLHVMMGILIFGFMGGNTTISFLN